MWRTSLSTLCLLLAQIIIRVHTVGAQYVHGLTAYPIGNLSRRNPGQNDGEIWGKHQEKTRCQFPAWRLAFQAKNLKTGMEMKAVSSRAAAGLTSCLQRHLRPLGTVIGWCAPEPSLHSLLRVHREGGSARDSGGSIWESLANSDIDTELPMYSILKYASLGLGVHLFISSGPCFSKCSPWSGSAGNL